MGSLARYQPPSLTLSRPVSLSRLVSLPRASPAPICRLSLARRADRVRIRRDTTRVTTPPSLLLRLCSVFTKAAPLILILLHIALQIAGESVLTVATPLVIV